MERIVKPRIIEAAAREPVTVAEAMAALRLDALATGESDLLSGYIAAAREHVEDLAGITIHVSTLELSLDAWRSGYITLWRATPLIEIVSVIYKDSDGVETTWDDAEYIADTDSIPGRLVLGYGQTWPTFTPYPVSPIRIRYKAGIAVASPEVEASGSIKTAILLLVGALWENRETEVISERSTVAATALKYGVDTFIAQNVAVYAF